MDRPSSPLDRTIQKISATHARLHPVQATRSTSSLQIKSPNTIAPSRGHLRLRAAVTVREAGTAGNSRLFSCPASRWFASIGYSRELAVGPARNEFRNCRGRSRCAHRPARQFERRSAHHFGPEPSAWVGITKIAAAKIHLPNTVASSCGIIAQSAVLKIGVKIKCSAKTPLWLKGPF